MPPFESSLASRIGPPSSPPLEARKPHFRNRVWIREIDETVQSHGSLIERLESSSDSLLRLRASGGNALDEIPTSPQNKPSLAQRLASPTSDDTNYHRDRAAVSQEGSTSQAHMDLGKVDEFIASAIQEGARAQSATADCPGGVERSQSLASEASVDDLLAGVRDADTDEERPTDANIHDTIIEDEEAHAAVIGIDGRSAGSDQGSVRSSSNGNLSAHIAGDRRDGTGRVSVDPTTTSVVARALNEDAKKTLDDKQKASGHDNLGAQGQLLNETISPNNRGSHSGNFGDHAEDTISSVGGVQDHLRTEVRPEIAQPDVTPADSKPQPPAPTNPLLEEAKRLLIPVITENARLRDPDADIEIIKEKVMSLVTDEQCLEFVRLAKDVNGQMQDRQKKQEKKVESESSTGGQMNVHVSGDDVKTGTKRFRGSSEEESSNSAKVSRYAGLSGTRGVLSTTSPDVSTSDAPPHVKRTPKAPRAMLPRDERFKAQDLLRFVESDLHSKTVSRRQDSPRAQRPLSSSRAPPPPLSSRVPERSRNATSSSPRASSRWDTPESANNVQLSGLQLNLTSEPIALPIAAVIVPESTYPPTESLQQSTTPLSKSTDAVQETMTIVESSSEHANSECISSLTPNVIPEHGPAETVATRQTPEATEIDSIASTPRPSSPMVIDEPVVEVPLSVESLQDKIVADAESVPQDEPMPLVDETAGHKLGASEQILDDEVIDPPENDANLQEETVHNDGHAVNDAPEPEQPLPEPAGPAPPPIVYPEDPVPGLWFAAVGRDRPDVYDIVFNVSEETATAVDRWCKHRVVSGDDSSYAYVHLLCLPVPAVSKMNEELEPTASPADIVARLQAIPTAWPASGKLIVQFDTDSKSPAIWYPGREDLKDMPIDVGPYIRPGRNSARVIQLADASSYFLVLCAGVPSRDVLQQLVPEASK